MRALRMGLVVVMALLVVAVGATGATNFTADGYVHNNVNGTRACGATVTIVNTHTGKSGSTVANQLGCAFIFNGITPGVRYNLSAVLVQSCISWVGPISSGVAVNNTNDADWNTSVFLTLGTRFC